MVENVRTSLFLVPMVGVVLAVATGLTTLAIDRRMRQGVSDLPLGLSSTVDSARAVLTTIAGATITVAGIAFSVSLLVIQLGSSQYSPRVVHTLFRDPFNKRVMGLVVGTFTYCLVVLRSVRSAIEEGGTPVIPNLSVSIAVLLGIAAVLAIVAFINHSAHTMDVSEILERASREAISQFHSEWPTERSETTNAPDEPSEPSHDVRFDRTGWIQQLDTDALLHSVGEGATIYLDAQPGRYAIIGTRLCTVSPPPQDAEAAERRIIGAIGMGDTRTMQQDPAYGLRQLVDVALRALSPGINDPTTAQDAIFHATAVLGEALCRYPPPTVRSHSGRRLVLLQHQSHEDLVRLTFDEIRRAATTQPTVCVYLLEALELLSSVLEANGCQDRLPFVAAQARLVWRGCEAGDLIADDVELVREAYRKRFGRPAVE